MSIKMLFLGCSFVRSCCDVQTWRHA